MKLYKGNPSPQIRERLDKLCNPKFRLFDDPVQFRKVFFPEFKKNLALIAPPPDGDKQYNCYGYALGLTDWVGLYVIAQALKNNALIRSTEPKSGDLVVYFDQSEKYIRHAARYTSDEEVKSKWAGGPVFQHYVFFCPMTYGDRVDYFRSLDAKTAKELVNKYPAPNL